MQNALQIDGIHRNFLTSCTVHTQWQQYFTALRLEQDEDEGKNKSQMHYTARCIMGFLVNVLMQCNAVFKNDYIHLFIYLFLFMLSLLRKTNFSD